MANHKSAKKRARQSVKRHARNNTIRSATRTELKKALDGIRSATSKDEALKALRAGERSVQKAVSKGIVPKARASRKTSRLATALNTKFKTA